MLFAVDVLKNFTKITGKQLRQSLCLINLQANNIFLQETASSAWSNFQWSLVQYKLSSENVCISLKTECKRQVT